MLKISLLGRAHSYNKMSINFCAYLKRPQPKAYSVPKFADDELFELFILGKIAGANSVIQTADKCNSVYF